MKAELNKLNIEKASIEFSTNNNFTYTVLPRLRVLYTIKKKLKHLHDLKWMFEFDYVNINQNRLIIEYLPSVGTDLNLFYEIPLMQKFELRSYLGNSSVHFIDIYNFLLQEKHIEEKQFTIHAEYRKIPHFVLNLRTNRYHKPTLILYSKSGDSFTEQIDEAILEEIKNSFELFNPIFKLIVADFIQ